MDITGAVTAAAAGLAAVLAAVNLYVSGRRELRKWTREALVEALVVFLDASFRQTGVCRALPPSTPAPDAEQRRLQAAAVEAHDIETDTLTRLRLLAPSRVVKAAEALHQAEHEMVDAFFAESPMRTEDIDDALAPARRAREQFLQSARSALQLGDTATIEHSHRGTGWHEFRALTKAWSDRDGAQL